MQKNVQYSISSESGDFKKGVDLWYRIVYNGNGSKLQYLCFNFFKNIFA